MIVKTRFCPSPTGLMHLGNVRTALFNALWALHEQGSFLLRIEDTDKARSEEHYAEVLMADLRWLGLDWQEGPNKDQGRGPYWQSQRQSIYDHYYQILEKENLVYPCFCSDEELALTRKVQLASGQPPRYAGTCRHLSKEQIDKKLAEGLKPTLRFQVPSQQWVEFTDFVRGKQRFNTEVIGDFIIRRADGTASFLYSNAIDDALMEVNHALRGEDHLTNTPRQLLILKALKLPAPQYGHISMIMGKDGTPLSKRHGSKSIQELREEGYLPDAIVNYLARLGHYYESNDYMSLPELAKAFALKNLSNSPAKFDPEQLLFWQKEAVMRADAKQLTIWLKDALELVSTEKQALFIDVIRHNVLFPLEAKQWAQKLFGMQVIDDAEKINILREAGENFFKAASELLAVHQTNYQNLIKALQEATGLKGKQLYQPLRLGLSMEFHGPEIAQIINLLGVEEARERLLQVSEVVRQSARV